MNVSNIESIQEISRIDNFTKEIEEFISPEHVTTDPYEIEASSADLSLLPKYHYKFKKDHKATHVIRPATTEELSKVMKKCNEYSLPVTFRAAGTSCYSSSTPTKGGVLIDVRRMQEVHEVDVENMRIRCDAGISWLKLIETLLDYGLSPKCYPTSYKSSCVAGFVATSGKIGIGVLNHGTMIDVLLSVVLVKPDGSIEKISKDSKGDLSLDDIIGSFGILGAVAEVEMEVTSLKTSMERIGYGFKSIEDATKFYLDLKHNKENIPFFLSLSDKNFERYAHWTFPSRNYFVYGIYFDDPDITSRNVSFAKEAASKSDGLAVEEWYLKEKWHDIADTEVNIGRWCNTLFFQEYWVSDERLKSFYINYANKTLKYNYNKAFYVIAGTQGGNRIKIFGLTDIANSREFFGIKGIFHDISLDAYKQNDSIYTIGVVNTLYNLKFNPERVSYLKQLKNQLDPEDRINSYRLVRAKMRWSRVKLLFYISKLLYKP
ncbi:MAG: FAD-binding oxidoreductase [Promethearchaeota archaeon]|jgi:FAD/FMN-containing dehydrogenase